MLFNKNVLEKIKMLYWMLQINFLPNPFCLPIIHLHSLYFTCQVCRKINEEFLFYDSHTIHTVGILRKSMLFVVRKCNITFKCIINKNGMVVNKTIIILIYVYSAILSALSMSHTFVISRMSLYISNMTWTYRYYNMYALYNNENQCLSK